jgi:hypothetical protein
VERTGEASNPLNWSEFEVNDRSVLRYRDGFLNQKKSAHRILDPFRVKDDWLDLLLPSLQNGAARTGESAEVAA